MAILTTTSDLRANLKDPGTVADRKALIKIVPKFLGGSKIGDARPKGRLDGLSDPADEHGVDALPVSSVGGGGLRLLDGAIEEAIFELGGESVEHGDLPFREVLTTQDHRADSKARVIGRMKVIGRGRGKGGGRSGGHRETVGGSAVGLIV